MSTTWRPDDSLLERSQKGEVKGVSRVKDALKNRGVRYGNRVITSRDKGMAAVQRDLKRGPMPPGIQQWQIPIAFGPREDILFFVGVHKPGSKVPEHMHKDAVLHIVVKGSMKHRGRVLKPGDWILVPPGQSYSLIAGSEGVQTCYVHGRWSDLAGRAGAASLYAE